MLLDVLIFFQHFVFKKEENSALVFVHTKTMPKLFGWVCGIVSLLCALQQLKHLDTLLFPISIILPMTGMSQDASYI